ncbi:MAG: DUF4388 domain-containing protein [Actinomycetia bacterium]|nr:DUF4388 domain-containing protein [Actinomycetes bacterium]MCP4224483.1 DUF4388 domain-containing protein [Actinomycetes bacterium]MCP5031154.1 DUF4388 domain-containing protein [Actinomycetes bacterium]
MESDELVEGSLAAITLPKLLAAMAGKGETGSLAIAETGDIWFSEGCVYLASTPTSPDLATVLFDASVGSPEEVAAVLRVEGTPRPSDGGALDQLLAEHPDAEDGLRRLLHEYTLNSLFEMLVPSDATFHFVSGEVHPIGARFAEDAAALIAKAEQRMEIWRRIATRIPSTSAIFSLSESLPAEIDERVVSADEWRFLSKLDGRNTVADVINETGESAFRVCSSLYRLLLEGLLIEADPAPA